MKHWLLVGLGIIIGVVLVFRVRISNTSTVSPAMMPKLGAGLNQLPASPLATRPIDASKFLGVPANKLKGISIASSVPSTRVLDSLKLDVHLNGSAAPTYIASMEGRVPAELLLVRAQPAVYRILEYGDLDVRVPEQVTIDVAALAKAHDATGKLDALRLAGDADRVAFYWDQVATNPEAYLTTAKEGTARSMKNELMASGTGFLISRDGTVLTNAHVIGDMPDQALGDDPVVLVGLVGEKVDRFMIGAVASLGGAPTQEQAPTVALALVRWFGAHGRLTGTFNHVELALHLDRKKLTAKGYAEAKDISALLTRGPEPITCPLTVLAKGAVIPGKDVAVLRAERGGSFDVLDRAVCLPLGVSGDVLPGTRVQAMGFPGIAFDAGLMKPDAEYRVSAADGQIANTKAMAGGAGNDWDAFEMTADINHGDSGGPVIAPDGRVIALNVGAAQGEKSVGHTLAVPIDLAKEMLAELNITPDPGPVTALWIDGLAKYAKADYAGAAERFEQIAAIQADWQDASGAPSPMPHVQGFSATYEPSVNPYVTEMLRRAKAKTKP